MVNLLGGAPDDKELEVGVSVGRRLTGDLHERPRLLVDGLDVLPSPADHQATLVGRDGEGHLSPGGTPAALTLTPATVPVPWGHAWRTRGSLGRESRLLFVFIYLKKQGQRTININLKRRDA